MNAMRLNAGSHASNNAIMVEQLMCVAKIAHTASSLKASLERAVNRMHELQKGFDESNS